MPNYVLFDDPTIRTRLLPLTFTRPVSELRVGIRTITEKWTDWLGERPSFLTQPYLQTKFLNRFTDDNLYLNGAVLPTEEIASAVRALKIGEGLVQEGMLLAYRSGERLSGEELMVLVGGEGVTDLGGRIRQSVPRRVVLQWPDLFALNGEQIRADFARITAGRTSEPITDRFTAVYNESQIFLEPGVQLRAAVLNAEAGPIYLGRNVQVQEGALIQGPFAALEGSVINLGGKMRRNTTIGPFCKVGGEVSQSVLLGYSNKGHDGFMGNSYVGEWCNWGAATNNSNLKNDYGSVKLHSYEAGQLEDSGRQFVGLFMGDHSKAGIGTLFNTGTVVGVNVNVFGAGFQPKHVPSFSWGGADTNFTTYQLEKALAVARTTMERRGQVFSEADEAILRHVFEATWGQ
jgi:UDP-N-acetylglucosamine diphosphorylase/glucosamine-1-phosphate N-acetyltransferase